ncbi:MAG: hypothetical protein LBN27_00375 [Prevotellaceae bacterium]|jgi:hypothetical protein|nr:hypothetical protein [Prevotellaceae bacterium]
MKKILLITICTFLCANAMWADGGFFAADRSYITINGTAHKVYDNGDVFSTKALGTFNVGTAITISAYDAKTWKSGSGDVTGITFYYIVYPTGSRPATPSFTAESGNWLANLNGDGSNQKWGFPGKSININPGIAGNYTLEFYAQISGSNLGEFFDSGSGSNYKATFTIPAPTVSLSATPATVCVGSAVTLSNATNYFQATPTVTYQVKIGGGAYATCTSSYTCATAGTYTFKATATYNSQTATSAEQTVVAAEPITVKAKLPSDWESQYVKMYFWDNGALNGFHNVTVETINCAQWVSYTFANCATSVSNWQFSRYDNFDTGKESDKTAYPTITSSKVYFIGEWAVDGTQRTLNEVPSTSTTQISLAASASEVIVGNQITLTPTIFNACSPVTTYSMAFGGAYTPMAGNTFTPTQAGTYKFKATANGAESNEVTVTVTVPALVWVGAPTVSVDYEGTTNNNQALSPTFNSFVYNGEYSVNNPSHFNLHNYTPNTYNSAGDNYLTNYAYFIRFTKFFKLGGAAQVNIPLATVTLHYRLYATATGAREVTPTAEHSIPLTYNSSTGYWEAPADFDIMAAVNADREVLSYHPYDVGFWYEATYDGSTIHYSNDAKNYWFRFDTSPFPIDNSKISTKADDGATTEQDVIAFDGQTYTASTFALGGNIQVKDYRANMGVLAGEEGSKVDVRLNYKIKNSSGDEVSNYIPMTFQSFSPNYGIWTVTNPQEIICSFASGTYTIEVWYSAKIENLTVYDSNDGANYIATITKPAPSGILQPDINNTICALRNGNNINVSLTGAGNGCEADYINKVIVNENTASPFYERGGGAALTSMPVPVSSYPIEVEIHTSKYKLIKKFW